MSQPKHINSSQSLPDSLAQRIYHLRKVRNLTVLDLAKMSKFPEKRIEEIESGFETWFSSVDRQRLAKALGVEPYILKEVETRTSLTDELKEQLQMRELNDKILAGENGLSCPHCNHTLNTSVQNGLDIEGLPIQFAKAFCTKCPFVLK